VDVQREAGIEEKLWKKYLYLTTMSC